MHGVMTDVNIENSLSVLKAEFVIGSNKFISSKL